MVFACVVAARKVAIASLTSLIKCSCVCGCLLVCRQERRVCCSSFVVCDFKRNFLIWCKISRTDCISQAAEVRHQPVRGSGGSQSETLHAFLRGAVFPLHSVELHLPSLLNTWILGALPWEHGQLVSQSNFLVIFIGSFMLFCIAYKIYTRL